MYTGCINTCALALQDTPAHGGVWLSPEAAAQQATGHAHSVHGAEWLQAARFVVVAAGRYHSAGVDAEGKLYTWGLNDFGQLGRGGVDSAGTACAGGWDCRSAAVVALSVGDERFVAVDAGRYHTLAVSARGHVWTCGLNFGGRPEVRLPCCEGAGASCWICIYYCCWIDDCIKDVSDGVLDRDS